MHSLLGKPALHRTLAKHVEDLTYRRHVSLNLSQLFTVVGSARASIKTPARQYSITIYYLLCKNKSDFELFTPQCGRTRRQLYLDVYFFSLEFYPRRSM